MFHRLAQQENPLFYKRKKKSLNPQNKLKWRIFVATGAFFSPFLLASITFAFQPNVIRIGTVELHPAILLGSTFNDNISLSQSKLPDGIFTVSPSLECLWGRVEAPLQRPRILNPYGLTTEFLLDTYLSRLSSLGERGYLGANKQEIPVGKPIESSIQSALQFRRYSVNVKYDPEIRQLIEHPEFNSVDHIATIMADFRSPIGLYCRINDKFWNSTTINSYRNEVIYLSRQQISEGVGFDTNLLETSIGYNFYNYYALYISYSYYWFSVQNFRLDPSITGFSIPGFLDFEIKGFDSGSLGMNLQTAGIFLDKIIKSKTNLSFGYIFGRLTGNMDKFNIYGELLGMEATARLAHDPRNAIFQEFRIGIQRVITARKYVFGWPVPKTSLEAIVAYQIRDFDRDEWIISIQGQPVLTTALPLPPFREVLANLKLNTTISPRTALSIYLLRQPNEAEGGTGNVSINWEIGASIDQKIKNKFSFTAATRYRYTQNTWPEATESKVNYIYTYSSLLYQIQNWLSLQLSYEFLARLSELKYNEYNSNRVKFNILLYF